MWPFIFAIGAVAGLAACGGDEFPNGPEPEEKPEPQAGSCYQPPADDQNDQINTLCSDASRPPTCSLWSEPIDNGKDGILLNWTSACAEEVALEATLVDGGAALFNISGLESEGSLHVAMSSAEMCYTLSAKSANGSCEQRECLQSAY